MNHLGSDPSRPFHLKVNTDLTANLRPGSGDAVFRSVFRQFSSAAYSQSPHHVRPVEWRPRCYYTQPHAMAAINAGTVVHYSAAGSGASSLQ